MSKLLTKLIGPKGILLISILITLIWFNQGLLFAGAEEQFTFYNISRTLDFYSYIWLDMGTGSPSLANLARLPWLFIIEPLFRLGVPNFILEAGTFLVVFIIGSLSVYYLIKETVINDLPESWRKITPFIAGVFYLLNPFVTTQIFGRALFFQIFSFALVPSFLLFFIMTLKRRNLIYLLIGVLLSFLLSGAYASPPIVITSWAPVLIYFIYYLFSNLKQKNKIIFGILAVTLLLVLWLLAHSFWIYPFIKASSEVTVENIDLNISVSTLKALAVNSHLYNAVRLIHREYYDGTYGSFYNGWLVNLISLLLPAVTFLSWRIFRKSQQSKFYLFLLVISLLICIGANFPSGFLFVWSIENFPILQMFRNPYEKFGINLVLAFSLFFSIGIIRLSYVVSQLFHKPKLMPMVLVCLLVLYSGVLVWPIWDRSFAGGTKANFWVQVPKEYVESNSFFNNIAGDFTILHLPLIPEDGITYTWEHPYEGIDGSEFLFDKRVIARNFITNKEYYSALIDRFGIALPKTSLPYWTKDNLDFKDKDLVSELAKLNTKFIVLHHDLDYQKRRALSSEMTRQYLDQQIGIKKVKEFGKLEIYQVDLPKTVNLIYSNDASVNYRKVNTSKYIVDVKGSSGKVDLYFLEQFHRSWQALVDGQVLASHKKAFSYANMWEIQKSGDFMVELRFSPESYVYQGVKISIISVIVILLILILARFKIWQFRY